MYSGTAAVADEIMVDEIAAELGSDPVAFRLAEAVAARASGPCVDKVGERRAAGAGRCRPGHAQGVAIHQEYKGCVACLVEIDATDPADAAGHQGRRRRRRRALHQPARARGPAHGRTSMDGISVTLQAGNHLDNGAIRESSYTDFRWARMRHSPPADRGPHHAADRRARRRRRARLSRPPRPRSPTPTPGPPAPVPAASRSSAEER